MSTFLRDTRREKTYRNSKFIQPPLSSACEEFQPGRFKRFQKDVCMLTSGLSFFFVDRTRPSRRRPGSLKNIT